MTDREYRRTLKIALLRRRHIARVRYAQARLSEADRRRDADAARAGIDIAEIAFIRLRVIRPQRRQP